MPPEPTPTPRRIKVKSRTPASSTRKKLVKDGNRKLIGPRTFQSELLEDADKRSVSSLTLKQLEALNARGEKSWDLRDQIRYRNVRSIGSQNIKDRIRRMIERAIEREERYGEGY